MRSKTTSVKLPESVLEASRRRAAELGYPSFNSYLLGLLRYDLLVRGPHTVTRPIAGMDLARQDALDAELLRLEMNGNGRGKRGVLLAHLVERAVEKLGAAATGDEIAAEVVDGVMACLASGEDRADAGI